MRNSSFNVHLLFTACFCTVAVKKKLFCLCTVARCELFRENGVLAMVLFYTKRQFCSVLTISILFHDSSASEAPFC